MRALESLLCEKALSSIDVKQLCERANVARSTFYAYYRNTDELMEQLEDNHVSHLASMNEWVASHEGDAASISREYGPTLDYLEKNSAFFYAELITHHNGRLSEKWKDAIKRHLSTHLKRRALSSRSCDIADEVASSVVVSACVYWLKNPASVSREDIYRIIGRSLKLLPEFVS